MLMIVVRATGSVLVHADDGYQSSVPPRHDTQQRIHDLVQTPACRYRTKRL